MDKIKHFGSRFVSACLLAFPMLSELFSISSRCLDLIKIWHLISRNGIRGDYLEFGVYEGDSFANSIRAANNSFKSSSDKIFKGKFFAFDSFKGLPECESLGQAKNIFKKGEYSCSQAKFESRITKYKAHNDIRVISGWYEDVLTPQLIEREMIDKAVLINIDCDLYESTLSCLNFITPLLQSGTVIIFDDWFLMGGQLSQGEAQATREWLKSNPMIELIDYGSYGIWGKAFIVNM